MAQAKHRYSISLKGNIMTITIEQCRAVCKAKPEFTERNKGNYIVFDYNLNDSHSFDDPVAIEMRGIAFDLDGNIVSRPLHKFFNYGEKPVDLDSDSMVIMDKLDGSMIRTIKVGDSFVLGTRAGETDVSAMATKFVQNSKIHYDELCRVAIESQVTAIFEFCSPENRVVIDYGAEPQMTLLALRYNSGEYVPRVALVNIASMFNVPVVKQWRSIEFVELMKTVKDLKGAEGVVIASNTGWCKIKADEYCIMHKAVDQVKFDKDAAVMVLKGVLDDCLPLLTPTRRDQVEALRSLILDGMHNMSEYVKDEYTKVKHLDRKELAMTIKDHPFRHELFKVASGHDAYGTIIDRARKATSRIADWGAFVKLLAAFV
jgi:RNA ligase